MVILPPCPHKTRLFPFMQFLVVVSAYGSIYLGFGQWQSNKSPVSLFSCSDVECACSRGHFLRFQRSLLTGWIGSSSKGASDAFQILQNFLVHSCQFLVYANRTIAFASFAFLGIGTSRAVFTLVDFFFSSVFISLYWLSVFKMECLMVRTPHGSFLVNFKVHRAKWIIVVYL